MARLYVKLSSKVFHTPTFLCVSLFKLIFWLLIGEKKRNQSFIWARKTYNTAQDEQKDLSETRQWGFQQLTNGTTQMDKSLRGRNKNARYILQLRLNHAMVTNNSKILVNFNNKGLSCSWQALCLGKCIAHSQKKVEHGGGMQWLSCFFFKMVPLVSTYILLV